MAEKIFGLIALGLVGWLIFTYDPIDKANTLLISGPFEFTSQDLSKDGDIYTRMQVAETLVGVSPDGVLEPKLAAAWEELNHGLEWQFILREGVNFQDGSPMTAASVVNSLEIAARKTGILQNVPIAGFTAIDNRLVVRLTQPFRPLTAVLAHFSTAILAPSSYDDAGEVVDLKGTGPYQISLLAPPHKLHVKAFANYWGEKVSINEVRYLTGHRAESRALQAESGQADLIYTLDPASIEKLNSVDSLTVHSYSTPRTVIIKLNNDHPLLNHRDVRQAISLAIDRTGISEKIVRVAGSEAYQLFPPAIHNWHLHDELQRKQDIAQAKRLLEGLGWQLNSQGIMQRGSDTFSLNMVTYADRPELTVIATAIQAQLRRLGIELSITVDNSSAIPARHHDGSLELALVARNFGTLADPLALLVDDFATHHGGDWGAMNWSSQRLNRLLATMMASRDEKKYQHLAQQSARILADEMPLIPVVFYTQQISVNNRVKNFVFDPFEHNYRVSEMYFND